MAPARGSGADTPARAARVGVPRSERPPGECAETLDAAPDLAALLESLRTVQGEMIRDAANWRPWVEEGRDGCRDASARNLLQYLALRRRDLRPAQDSLAALGVSSLGRCEGHVQATLDAAIAALTALRDAPPPPPAPAPISVMRSRELLARRTADLLGPHPAERATRIMVTMPTQAADDADLVSELLRAGMNCARINGAHDTPNEWRAMRENLVRAREATGLDARLLVDLPGPKLRTGPIASAPALDKRGSYLRLRTGDRVLLVREGAPSPLDDSVGRIACSLDEAFAATQPGHRVCSTTGRSAAWLTRSTRTGLTSGSHPHRRRERNCVPARASISRMPA